MRAPLRRASAAFAALSAVTVACGAVGRSPVSVSVGPSLLFPRDVLQNATSASLVVYDATTGVACDPKTGMATGVASVAPAASAQLGPCGATSAAKFCGTLLIGESSATRLFAASASDAAGATIANGCSALVVDQASENVSITMIAASASSTATCGNGAIETGEQCDPPPAAGADDAVCDAQCHSKEEVLSTATVTPQGPAFLLWPSDPTRSEDLLAFFSDADASNSGGADVVLRVMSSALEPVSTPSALATAFVAPNDTTATLPPLPAPGNQSQPSAAFVLGTYFYVFKDDSFGSPATHMRSFDATFAGQEPQAEPIVIDGPTAAPVMADAGGPGGSDGGGDGGSDSGSDAGTPGQGPDSGAEPSGSPSVAVSGSGSLFIAWEDLSGATAGQILGRTYTPTGGALGLVSTISTGAASNENPRVAGTATGWVVVWDDVTAIKMRVYSGNGTANGPEILVSDATHTGVQDHPAIAVLADGRVAVVWADHGTAEGADIFVQRYDANFVAAMGDHDRFDQQPRRRGRSAHPRDRRHQLRQRRVRRRLGRLGERARPRACSGRNDRVRREPGRWHAGRVPGEPREWASAREPGRRSGRRRALDRDRLGRRRSRLGPTLSCVRLAAVVAGKARDRRDGPAQSLRTARARTRSFGSPPRGARDRRG